MVELLIVIVILGILATVVVMAVAGITDDSAEAATVTDERVLIEANEAYFVIHRTYATEAELVTAGFLRSESTLFDIAVAPDLASYTLDPVATP